MKKILYISIILFSIFGYSQKKVIQTQFTSEKIVIDGKPNEKIWNTVPTAKDFVMFEPDNGKPIPAGKKSEVKVVYDNDGIYISALLYDDEPNKILKEISKRDNFGAADLFIVFLNGYNDGQQQFEFIVSASDGQGDALITDANGEDSSWDAVWESKAIITDFGWSVEMKIPYAALRFSGDKKQTWAINFWREIKRDLQKYTWNLIDNKVGTFTQQNGILEGIENIKTPTRLFLLPYASSYIYANANHKTFGTLKGGLDIKYGINDAFTLDAILIPDFGQTKYDDKILNLGPFEQQFNENRSFFTEGTEMFSKGDLLYSRRIGGRPSIYPTTEKGEIITNNPSGVNLINALKISGRTKNGLGIGILNAVTEKTYATLYNTITGDSRNELVEPLANYNELVLDQRFHKNSSISLVNTNVTRNGSFRDGNVSALVWDLNTTKNTFNLSGNFKYSYVNDVDTKKGINSNLNLSETSGKYRYGIGADITTKHYDNNDMGINFQTNYYTFYGNASYRILNPTKVFNTFNTNFNFGSQFQKETGKAQDIGFNININSKTKKNNYFGMGFNIDPLETYDYYEPRTEGRFVVKPSRYGSWFYFSSNSNYKFAIDINPSYAKLGETERNSYGIMITPRYRFSDKMALEYSFDFFRQNNNKGYVDRIDEDNTISTPETIVFANRNVIFYSNTVTGKYSINSQMNFNLSLREYWSYAENKNYLSLEQNGKLIDNPSYLKNKNSSFYSWNFDLSYSWWFAPGSQVSILYRNNAANFENIINKKFTENVTNLLNNDALNHIFSISVRYFIDYNVIKNKI